jgi:hypothetical protein
MEINRTQTEPITNYYEKNTTRIEIGNTLTEEFQAKRGLRHGCCMCSALFKMYLVRTLQGWQSKWRNKELQVADMLYTWHFAEEQRVTAEDEDDLSYVVSKLQEAREHRGLIMNKKKSEHMIFGNDEKQAVPLEDGSCI